MTFLHIISLSIGVGILAAFIKILLEYPKYELVKNEWLFHGAAVAIILLTYVSLWYRLDWKAAQIFLLTYWNVFELAGNFFHNKELLYVGQEADFDKFIRKHFRYKRAKLALHIITIILLIILSISLYHEIKRNIPDTACHWHNNTNSYCW